MCYKTILLKNMCYKTILLYFQGVFIMRRFLYPIFLSFVLLSYSCVSSSDSNNNSNSWNNGGNHDVIDDSDNNDTDDDTQDTTNNNNNQNNNNNTNNWTPPQNSLIYANTKTTLYYIDPSDSTGLVEIGDFSGDCVNGSGFYDLALDEDRNLLGIAAEGLYSIDKNTADCTLLYQFQATDPHFMSLSYVKGVKYDDPSQDVLIGASAEDGEWVEIDPNAELGQIFVGLGYYDFPDYKWVSSGDIVSVQINSTDYRTYATLKCSSDYKLANPDGSYCESDYLAEIDPKTGNARLIGPTGYTKIFGLGFWGNKVYGFTGNGEYITIDVSTGTATLQEEYSDLQFWGAGTTTKPYIVQ